jgi:hypothetical protein
MSIQKAVSVFPMVARGVMLVLGLYLAIGFAVPCSASVSDQWSMSDVLHSAKGWLDPESRKIARNNRYTGELHDYKAKLDELEAANPNDVELLMGIVELRYIVFDSNGENSLRRRIAANWPEYKPAIVEEALVEACSVGWPENPLRSFDKEVARAPAPNEMRGKHYLEFMLQRDDPFIRVVDHTGLPDPNGEFLLVTDAIAARRVIAERTGFRADSTVTRVRHLGVNDPNNALYDYLEARWHSFAGRDDEMNICIKAAAGKKLDLYYAERVADLKKAMERAKMPTYLQEYVLDTHWITPGEALTMPLFLRSLRRQALERGDTEMARVLRSADAEFFATFAPPQRPRPTVPDCED